MVAPLYTAPAAAVGFVELRLRRRLYGTRVEQHEKRFRGN
jgi:hypothetical protein